MIRFAREGYPFIFGSLAVTFIAALFTLWGALVPFVLTAFMAFFFRDPERTSPEKEGIFVSPADGKVILIQDAFEGQYLMAHAVSVSIFMSPLDVHVNRSPCSGVVESVVHTPGKFASAFTHEAFLQNENIAMVLNTKYGKVMVRQVAGFLARRAVCRARPGDSLKKGERYGVIKFSSRVDLYLPGNAAVTVKAGDRVKAGETIIGKV